MLECNVKTEIREVKSASYLENVGLEIRIVLIRTV